MKSADEIIIKKEWHELSFGEKDMIRELASTEKEYNLLKKILQVSAEETTEAPALPDLKAAIHSRIRKPSSPAIRWYGWLAAACLLGIIISVILFQKKNEIPEIVKTTEQALPNPVTNDTSVTINPDSFLVKQPVKNKITKPGSGSPIQKPIPSLHHGTTDPVIITDIAVADHAGFLDLISEAE